MPDTEGLLPYREVRLKAKYSEPKPKGRFRADYGGNSGKSTAKGRPPPVGLRRVARGHRAGQSRFGHL